MKRIEVKSFVGAPIYLLIISIVAVVLVSVLIFSVLFEKARVGTVEFYLGGSRVVDIPLTVFTKDGRGYLDCSTYGHYLTVRVICTRGYPIEGIIVHAFNCGLNEISETNSSGLALINISSLYLPSEKLEDWIHVRIYYEGKEREYWSTSIRVFKKF